MSNNPSHPAPGAARRTARRPAWTGLPSGSLKGAVGLTLAALVPAAMARADVQYTWTCDALDKPVSQQVELVYTGPDVVPCKAYLVRPDSSRQLIANYEATRGQCERHVREMLSSLVARGYSCDEPEDATLLGIEARARGEAPSPEGPAGAPAAPLAPPAATAAATAQGDLYFAIISKQKNEAAARAEVARLRASDPLPAAGDPLAARGGRRALARGAGRLHRRRHRGKGGAVRPAERHWSGRLLLERPAVPGGRGGARRDPIAHRRRSKGRRQPEALSLPAPSRRRSVGAALPAAPDHCPRIGELVRPHLRLNLSSFWKKSRRIGSRSTQRM